MTTNPYTPGAGYPDVDALLAERDQLRDEVAKLNLVADDLTRERDRLRAELQRRNEPPSSEALTKLHDRAHRSKSSRPWRIVDWLVHHLDMAWMERDQLRAAVAAVIALHRPVEGLGFTDTGYGDINPACTRCGTSDEYAVPWPCATVAVLAGTGDTPGQRRG